MTAKTISFLATWLLVETIMKKKIRQIMCCIIPLMLAGRARAADPLETGFQCPPEVNRPSTFAFMLPLGPVQEAAITRDIEEIKAKGFSSCLIYTPGPSGHVPRGDTKLIYGETENKLVKTEEFKGPRATPEPSVRGNLEWSPEWLKCVHVAAATAGRVGLDLGLNIGGAGCPRGDLPPQYVEQTLFFSRTQLKGGLSAETLLPLPSAVPLSAKKEPLYYRDIAVLALPASSAQAPVQRSQVIDLTGKMDASGRLNWDAPAGDWVVLRFGHSITPGATVIDHLSAEALEKRWEATSAKLLAAMTPGERKGLTYVECDSYEGKAQTWTALMPQAFQARRGYDLIPWLPVLAKEVLSSVEESARFSRDYALTISDLFAENHYAKHKALANAAGLKFYAEAAGPHQHQSDLLKSISRCDVAMGEFWMPGSHRGVDDSRRFLLRDAAAAAHGYGMKQVFCEAFTGGNDPWRESPFYLKPCGDQAFCDGLTRPCFHGYNINVSLNDTPGNVYWAGVYFNRLTTWWEQAPAFLTYLARCSYLLEQGVFAADVAFYNGDGINRMITRKEVLGSQLGRLYDYDHFNNEILLTRMEVQEGRVVLPDGLRYRVLVLQKPEAISLAALRKFAALVQSGATLLGPRPSGLQGLEDPENQTAVSAEFERLVETLWGKSLPSGVSVRTVGKGRVIENQPVLDFLKAEGVPPDFACSGLSAKGSIDWIHRTLPEGDLYYVASKWKPAETVDCTFRVRGKLPELWDPVSGTIREAGAFRQANGCTTVPLKFDAFGSLFVLFRKAITEAVRTGQNWAELKPVMEVKGPWRVAFDPAWGGPETATFQDLADWTTRPEEGIRYYSGKATYRNTFTLSQIPAGPVFLDLGVVKEIAAVRLNGKVLGTVWTAPWRVEITAALQPGDNRLEIDVVNLWVNRLTGDTFLPKEKRFTKTNMTKYSQATQLLPSGLLGPVCILRGK